MDEPRSLGVRTFVRARRAVLAGSAAVAVLATAAAGSLPDPSERGIADALAEAARADVGLGGAVAVDPADVVWEPSRGAFVDAAWGRGVAFLARVPSPDGVGRRDAFRARVTVAPGGRAMRVAAIERRTETELADEHSLVARGDRLAWLTRGEGGEHGATLLSPEGLPGGAVERLLASAAGLAPRSVLHAVLETPSLGLRAELREEGLVLEIVHGAGRSAALLEGSSRSLSTSGDGPRLVVVEAPAAPPPSWPWKVVVPPPSPASPEVGALAADAVFPPGKLAWAPLVEGRAVVAGERPPPAPIARAHVVARGQEVLVHAFDLRQLVAHVVPAAAAPRARSGLPGTGRLPPADSLRAVAVAPAMPLRIDGGAIDAGRSVAPLEPGAPTIAASSDGSLRVGPAGAELATSALQSRAPGPDDRVVGWCTIGRHVALSAGTKSGEQAPIEAALGELGCASIVWLDAGSGVAPSVGDPVAHPAAVPPRHEPFLAFARRASFPEGRSEVWTASPGLQPAPTFAPAILERRERLLGVDVHVVAFVAGRFGWALRAGAGERSHRMKGAFLETLDADLAPRALAALSLGIGRRRGPNGLTIGGSTGHRYAGRGAVVLAGASGLQLVRSAELRGDPEGDATELPLTAEGGVPTSEARRRGLLHDRADLCVLPDGTVLVAEARFDSHEATAEALCRAGCAEVASLDRGSDRPARTLRASPEAPLPATFEETTLFALAPGAE